eukprot:scaffold63536_cov45-Phaeocystis_antarctica.AAC.1
MLGAHTLDPGPNPSPSPNPNPSPHPSPSPTPNQVEPGSIYLNRGNHENAELNERLKQHGGGFAEEARVGTRVR